MGMYKYMKEAFQKSYKEKDEALKVRIRAWRKDGAAVRIEKPTNLARARELGYKAKKEIIMARVKVLKGARRRKRPDLGRKPGRQHKLKNPGQTQEKIAMRKAQSRFPNCTMLNAYYVGHDGQYSYYEIIMQATN